MFNACLGWEIVGSKNVLLGSEIKHNQTPAQLIFGLLCLISEPIEPNLAIKFAVCDVYCKKKIILYR